jgi:hypothetical protein
VTVRQYAAEVRRYRDEIGFLGWAAPLDLPCEEVALRATGLSVLEHQSITLANYVEFRSLAPDLPIIPVLQGWAMGDYFRHVDMYARYGIGSVCRRQNAESALLGKSGRDAARAMGRQADDPYARADRRLADAADSLESAHKDADAGLLGRARNDLLVAQGYVSAALEAVGYGEAARVIELGAPSRLASLARRLEREAAQTHAQREAARAREEKRTARRIEQPCVVVKPRAAVDAAMIGEHVVRCVEPGELRQREAFVQRAWNGNAILWLKEFTRSAAAAPDARRGRPHSEHVRDAPRARRRAPRLALCAPRAARPTGRRSGRHPRRWWPTRARARGRPASAGARPAGRGR